MQLPGGDNLWSSRNVAATRPFLVSSRPDGSRTFLRELIRNQGIDTAYLNAVDELLQELTHVFSSNRRRGEDVPGPRRAEMPTSLGIDGRQVLLLAVLDLQNDCGFDRVAVFVELVGACHAREGRILHGIPDVRALDRAGSLERVEE